MKLIKISIIIALILTGYEQKTLADKADFDKGFYANSVENATTLISRKIWESATNFFAQFKGQGQDEEQVKQEREELEKKQQNEQAQLQQQEELVKKRKQRLQKKQQAERLHLQQRENLIKKQQNALALQSNNQSKGTAGQKSESKQNEETQEQHIVDLMMGFLQVVEDRGFLGALNNADARTAFTFNTLKKCIDIMAQNTKTPSTKILIPLTQNKDYEVEITHIDTSYSNFITLLKEFFGTLSDQEGNRIKDFFENGNTNGYITCSFEQYLNNHMPPTYEKYLESYVPECNDENIDGCYRILGLKNNDPESLVKRAYKKLALFWHPDKQADKELAESRFKAISNAYQIISDYLDAKKKTSAHQ